MANDLKIDALPSHMTSTLAKNQGLVDSYANDPGKIVPGMDSTDDVNRKLVEINAGLKEKDSQEKEGKEKENNAKLKKAAGDAVADSLISTAINFLTNIISGGVQACTDAAKTTKAAKEVVTKAGQVVKATESIGKEALKITLENTNTVIGHVQEGMDGVKTLQVLEADLKASGIKAEDLKNEQIANVEVVKQFENELKDDDGNVVKSEISKANTKAGVGGVAAQPQVAEDKNSQKEAKKEKLQNAMSKVTVTDSAIAAVSLNSATIQGAMQEQTDNVVGLFEKSSGLQNSSTASLGQIKQEINKTEPQIIEQQIQGTQTAVKGATTMATGGLIIGVGVPLGAGMTTVGTGMETGGVAMVTSGSTMMSNPFTAIPGAVVFGAGWALKFLGLGTAAYGGKLTTASPAEGGKTIASGAITTAMSGFAFAGAEKSKSSVNTLNGQYAQEQNKINAIVSQIEPLKEYPPIPEVAGAKV